MVIFGVGKYRLKRGSSKTDELRMRGTICACGRGYIDALLHGARAACCIEPTPTSAQQKVDGTSLPSLPSPQPLYRRLPLSLPPVLENPAKLLCFTTGRPSAPGDGGKGEKNLAGGAASQVQSFVPPSSLPFVPPLVRDRSTGVLCAAGASWWAGYSGLHCAVVPTSRDVGRGKDLLGWSWSCCTC